MPLILLLLNHSVRGVTRLVALVLELGIPSSTCTMRQQNSETQSRLTRYRVKQPLHGSLHALGIDVRKGWMRCRPMPLLFLFHRPSICVPPRLFGVPAAAGAKVC